VVEDDNNDDDPDDDDVCTTRVVIRRQSHVNENVAARPAIIDGRSTRNSVRISSNTVVVVVFGLVFIILPSLAEMADENSDNE
jgi:hypothetical protein